MVQSERNLQTYLDNSGIQPLTRLELLNRVEARLDKMIENRVFDDNTGINDRDEVQAMIKDCTI